MEGGPEKRIGRGEAPDLVLSVPTFRRNGQLRTLLPLLVHQVRTLERELAVPGSVLVVDNDAGAGARAVVEAFLLDDPTRPVRYVHEPTAGLAAVRNRVLDECRDIRLLACLDDDEVPHEEWLVELVKLWRSSGAGAVAGRIDERFESPPDPWVVAGGFFRRRRWPTGTQVEAAPTSNLLLDLDVIRRLGLRFDPRFGLSGGEDTHLTRRLTKAGVRIVWCDEAGVVDQVPESRAHREWVLARARSHGNSSALVTLAMTPSGPRREATRVLLWTGGLVRGVVGHVRSVAGRAVGSMERDARGLRLAHRGWGMVSGSRGRVIEEYARPSDG